MVEFVFDNGEIYLVFVAKVGVYGTTPFARFGGDVVHCDVGFAIHGELAACNINYEFAGFGLFVLILFHGECRFVVQNYSFLVNKPNFRAKK